MTGNVTPLRARAQTARDVGRSFDSGPLTEVDGLQSRSRKQTSRPPLGHTLVERGALSPGNLVKALAMQQREEARLGEILLTHSMVSEKDLLDALADQWRTEVVDLAAEPPDPRLVDRWGAARCLREGLVPWRRAGSVTVVVTARPEMFLRHLEALEEEFGPVAQAVCNESELRTAIEATRSHVLIEAAETKVAAPYHCRALGSSRTRSWMALAGLAIVSVCIAAPTFTLTALTFWAVFTLFVATCVRVGAIIAALQGSGWRHLGRPEFSSNRDKTVHMARLPMISVMVPLYKEEDIAGRLLKRLMRLSYPKELMDICLVVEAGDDKTRSTLSQMDLPRWMRVVTVPAGAVRTKPRALNYALDFCKGSIIGVWDAEDAPAPDQLHQVARQFHRSSPKVACLQGRLDFYNAKTNWLSRCFALEYAAWFRVILPGMIRLGFAIPLGGTTLFFRRDVLEQIGGWDAHNVTEDADLGIRLARLGYQTEMVHTVTHEEANARFMPWVRQRSRWLKGYAITYAVHMKNPVRLWRDLGAWQFFGVQVLFLCTLTQFILAPLLWSFWLVVLGLPHFFPDSLGAMTLAGLAGLFLMAELVSLTVAALGVREAGKRWLLPWVPSLHLYFPFAAIAAYKALIELVVSPFYWDKTRHGVFDETCALPEADMPQTEH